MYHDTIEYITLRLLGDTTPVILLTELIVSWSVLGQFLSRSHHRSANKTLLLRRLYCLARITYAYERPFHWVLARCVRSFTTYPSILLSDFSCVRYSSGVNRSAFNLPTISLLQPKWSLQALLAKRQRISVEK